MAASQNILWIGLGGFIGAVTRYLVSGWIQRLSLWSEFPLGTLGVNVISCLLIGFISGLTDRVELFSPHARLFIFIGILGSFSTFSTFGYEAMALLRDREMAVFLIYVVSHSVFGFSAVWGGYALTSLWQ